MVTQKRLKELLEYNPNTGVFTWLVKRGRTARALQIAGTINADGYIHIFIDGTAHKAHRLACLYMTGEFPTNETDHVNHIRNDNRWENLRKTTRSENQRNRPKQGNNTSGCTGVFWSIERNKWRALISNGNKRIHLGYYTEFWDAICSRKSAERSHGYHSNHGC